MKNKFFAFILILSLFLPFNIGVQAKEQMPPNILENNQVCIGGQTVGIAIYTRGLLVSEVSSFKGEDGATKSPAQKAGIKKGDYIISANGIELKDVSNIDAIILASKGDKIKITALRKGRQYQTEIVPQICAEDNRLHLGLYLKDSAAGLGTITFSLKQSGYYFALGHSITDFESGADLSVSSGRIVKCNINSIKKGTNGTAGELRGSFGVSSTLLGTVEANTSAGIYGKTNPEFVHGKQIEVAEKEEITEGDAQIFCSVEGEVKQYSAEILMVSKNKNEKNLVIKIDDEVLLEKTGGIVQGMSGSPVVQNGKLIGAVTHVMLADSSCGYGIFIENMVKEAKKVA